ncbi:hypothetical protein AB0E85_31600 [Streptomyces sp. NPDC029044]|uniref:hypothetical protein n=1 Tax=Streptomyces sp. NPDC029044 TaxID=3157198 RepID=UPI0033E0DCB7
MPTDYACQHAAERAAESVDLLRAFLHPGRPGEGGAAVGFDDWPMGASALLVILSGLQADTPGELTQWHAGIGYRIREALGLHVPGADSPCRGRQPRGWEALAAVQHKARELLTDLAEPGRLGRPAEFSRHLHLVEDAFAGALRRMGVPEESSVRCAAEMSEAAASLFGLRPSPPRSATPAPAVPTAAEPPARPDWNAVFPL